MLGKNEGKGNFKWWVPINGGIVRPVKVQKFLRGRFLLLRNS